MYGIGGCGCETTLNHVSISLFYKMCYIPPIIATCCCIMNMGTAGTGGGCCWKGPGTQGQTGRRAHQGGASSSGAGFTGWNGLTGSMGWAGRLTGNCAGSRGGWYSNMRTGCLQAGQMSFPFSRYSSGSSCSLKHLRRGSQSRGGLAGSRGPPLTRGACSPK